MVNVIWLNTYFFCHTVSEMGLFFWREVVMWSFPELSVLGSILKADDGFKAEAESLFPQVQVMMPYITDW